MSNLETIWTGYNSQVIHMKYILTFLEWINKIVKNTHKKNVKKKNKKSPPVLRPSESHERSWAAFLPVLLGRPLSTSEEGGSTHALF